MFTVNMDIVGFVLIVLMIVSIVLAVGVAIEPHD